MRPETARAIARIAHLGQSYGLDDYFEKHVRDVARRVYDDPRADDELVAVAWLHDVPEDTQVSYMHLESEGMTVRQGLALMALTRWPAEDYETYIKRVCSNEDACLVKFHDIRSNLSAAPPIRLAKRYLLARIQVIRALEKYKCQR